MWHEETREEAGLVKPGALYVEELEIWDESGQGKSVNRELRNGLVGPSVGLVIEDVNRTIARLQEIDVAGDMARLVANRRVGGVEGFLRYDLDAVLPLSHTAT